MEKEIIRYVKSILGFDKLSNIISLPTVCLLNVYLIAMVNGDLDASRFSDFCGSLLLVFMVLLSYVIGLIEVIYGWR